MKLSEAILLSIGVVRNARSWFYVIDGEPCGCAIVTGLYSVGGEQAASRTLISCSEALGEYWPWTSKIMPDRSVSYAAEISMRHYGGESRESIAAWVAIIEPEEGGIADNINLSSEVHNELQALTPGLTSLGVSCQG